MTNRKYSKILHDGPQQAASRSMLRGAGFKDEDFEKSIVGIVEVVKESYPDPTDKENRFVAVDVKATKGLDVPVSLDKIKKNKKLKNMALIKQSRLSVMPLTKAEWDEILKMSFK